MQASLFIVITEKRRIVIMNGTHMITGKKFIKLHKVFVETDICVNAPLFP
jgi:hypothetical protein